MLSYPQNIEPILNLILKLKPKKILDIGPGFGKWSILIREALLSDRAAQGELTPKDDIIIDCCECCQYFINQPYHQALYNHHYHKRIEEVDLPDDYDLLLLIDVIEHFPKEKGKELLKRLSRFNLLVSTPKEVVFYRTHFYGPDSEPHLSQWNEEDFIGWEKYSTPWSHIYYWSHL
jgi:2-polyprenyl-3-methyl-5-hydroxy-6-metoxy-1,4-benzoquinol methylase